MNAPATIDVTFTSDGPAVKTANILSVPITVSNVAVTTSSFLDVIVPFAQDFFQTLLSV